MNRLFTPPPPADTTLSAADAAHLDASLDDLRTATAALDTPPAIAATLRRAFVAHHLRAGQQARWRAIAGQWLAPGVALSACALMSTWMLLTPLAPIVTAPLSGAADTATNTPFIALQSLEQIALEPQPRLIQTSVPRMLLASYGVAVNPEVAGDNMRAELLVSAAGQPLAMRFVP